MSIGIFTCVCQEDEIWVGQYLAEMERLKLPFAMYFDRCEPFLIDRVCTHQYCIGHVVQSKPKEFDERVKQSVFNLLVEQGFCWAISSDIDETYELDAIRKLKEIRKSKADLIDIRWMNLWEDRNHIRTDGPFATGHRARIYNLQKGNSWEFYHPTVNGAQRTFAKHDINVEKSDLVCLHWGMMTQSLRQQHKERWDRIYTAAVGANPYGFWNYALDPSITPVTVPNEYLP